MINKPKPTAPAKLEHKPTTIDLSTFDILNEIPSELLSEPEMKQYKDLLLNVRIEDKEIDSLRESQVSINYHIINLIFVVTRRVAKLRTEYAPIKANIIEEIHMKYGAKITIDLRNKYVEAHPGSAIYEEAISAGDLLLGQLQGMRKTMEYRATMVSEKSYEARQDRKDG